jgi:hypothetical protein
MQAAELSADFRDSRAHFREKKKITSADKKFRENFPPVIFLETGLFRFSPVIRHCRTSGNGRREMESTFARR